jgi:hypothetical protein
MSVLVSAAPPPPYALLYRHYEHMFTRGYTYMQSCNITVSSLSFILVNATDKGFTVKSSGDHNIVFVITAFFRVLT